MNVVDRQLNEIKPYENNPRKNDKAVQYVANSIKDFGFKVPIVIDKDGVIVCGHTRYKAAQKLKLHTVPCVIADDLTEKQIQMFRIADNKVSEQAKWDNDLLAIEFGDIVMDFNIEDYGFAADFEDQLERLIEPGSASRTDNYDVGQYYGDEKERTLDAVNLRSFDDRRCYGYWEIPTLHGCDVVPEEMIGFNYVLSATEEDYGKGVHFFLDDYQFERVWREPFKYIEKLKRFKCVCTPDFSPYADMPTAMKVWNVYRNRMFGQMMEDAGINVIPTITWSSPDTYDYVLDGVAPGATVIVSTVTICKYKDDQIYRDEFPTAMEEMIERIKPGHILLYGSKFLDFDNHGVPVTRIKARQFGGK